MITLHDNAGRPTRLAASAMALAVALTLAAFIYNFVKN